MGASGTTTLDFGAFIGAPDATVAVTGQTGILSGSLVECWILPVDTTDHTAAEHIIDPPQVVAGNIVAGTGFTIYGICPSQPGIDGALGTGNAIAVGGNPNMYGKWTIAWVWN